MINNTLNIAHYFFPKNRFKNLPNSKVSYIFAAVEIKQPRVVGGK